MNHNKDRFLYIDNLRLVIIILVVMIHLAVTYSGIGSWYFTEGPDPSVIIYVLFALFQMFTQAYFMGLLFLVSGYFVNKSYSRKGFKKFLADRLIRLGIPTLLYMLIINPFIDYILLGKDRCQDSFAGYYTDYVISFRFIGESGPLWFAFALLLFNIIYAFGRLILKSSGNNHTRNLPGRTFPLIFISITFLCTFLTRFPYPIDTSVLNMQLCNFSQYIIMFIIGVTAGKNDWFTKLRYSYGKSWLKFIFIFGILFWIIIIKAGGAADGDFQPYKGGLHWQSAAFSLWESIVAFGMSVGLIALFKEKYNRQNHFLKGLSDNSFSVYLFHAPIIVGISLVFKNLELRHFIKFFLACILEIPICFLFSHYLLRKIPLLKNIL